jgi:hypothetical protein
MAYAMLTIAEVGFVGFVGAVGRGKAAGVMVPLIIELRDELVRKSPNASVSGIGGGTSCLFNDE